MASFRPYTLYVSCPHRHLGYIIGRGGRGIRNLVDKWNGRILEAFVCHPVPELGRSDHHITIVGEERAVHLLGLEMNEMIKVSMGRQEANYRCSINIAESNLQNQNAADLKIKLLEEELMRLKSIDRDESGCESGGESGDESDSGMEFKGEWGSVNE